MKVISQHQTHHLLRFDPGEEVKSGIESYCEAHKIHAATFTALGACESVRLMFYVLDEKKYESIDVDEELEITGITGNVALKDGNTLAHAHGTFGKKDYSVVGGHIDALVVSATCEVSLHILPGKIERIFDEQTGLHLMS